MAQAAAGPTGPRIGLPDLQGDARRARKERYIRALFFASGALSIVISALIVVSLFGEALTFLTNVDLPSLIDPSKGWFPRRARFDFLTIITGTVTVSLIAMLVAAPLGLGAAMYLSEYANSRLRKVLKPILEILAGIPSVVLGYFALTWLSPNIVKPICTDQSTFNLGAAGIAVGILITPLVVSVAEDSLRAVPMSLREASYGMGARKMSTTLHVVVPAAISGIVASLILALSRAIGETMVVAIAAGATGGSELTINACGPGQTMTAAMTSLAIGSDQVRGQEGTFESLFFVGLVLFFMTLVLNLLSERFVRRVRQRY
jgi:phosphate transport system permease protein